MPELKVVDIKDVPGERRDPPRTSWILISEKTVGAKNLAMGINETDPGGIVPEHVHEKEEEVMYFLSGKGKFVTEEREIPVESGIAIYNPPGKPHKIINTGDEILRFVWIYSPQLPSHRE
ncbi:MAG: cupin domain-containing protein [Deltaproteobacteria bacterium]|nr:MAG: cupin domain-containing protein [Deltaproteobacteria bacterium]